MPNLDIDEAIAQLTELLEQIFEFPLQREVSATTIRRPLRLRIQLDCLNDARFRFIKGRPAAN